MNPKLSLKNFSMGLVLTALSAGLLAQDQERVLETTKKIADKIIRESSFDTRLAPLVFNGGILRFSTNQSSISGDEGVVYALVRLASDTDSSGTLGLSFKGRIRLFLNGAEVFSGSSDRMSIQEYTYNRYRFQQRIPVFWKKGINEVLVKCGEGPVTVLLLPVDDTDATDMHLSPMAVSPDTPHVWWIKNGPWSSGSKPAMLHEFPPECGFMEFYQQGGDIQEWTLQEVPLLRELVIPEQAAYQRDSYADWHYANGGTMLGLLSLYELCGDRTYLDFVRASAQNLVDNFDYFKWQYVTYPAMRGSYHRIFRMTMLDDSGGPAIPFAQLQLMEPEREDLKAILSLVFDYVMNGQERLEDGTFSRPEPEAATVWADDLFMSVPFLLRMAQLQSNETLCDEVAHQVIRFHSCLSDPVSRLYFHGWYDQRKEHTPVRWGRANGWIIWATSEALLHLPPTHPEYKAILNIYQEHMKALVAFQDKSGMWHQVLDHPETFEETSCTAMFTLGLARGVRLGWLDTSYTEQALRGWKALQDKIRTDGTVTDICRGTGIGDDVEFYENRKRFDHDPRGLGAMLTAGVEISLLLDQ